jgi:hypothetical protein
MITKEQLLHWFDYKDGELYWKNRTAPGSHVKTGQKAGRPHSGNGKKSGYSHVHILGKNYLTHRLIFLMFNGYLPKEVDHINGNRSDSRIENLRASDKSQNAQNAKIRKDNTTGVKGVYPSNGKYKAQIQCNKQRHSVGCFDTIAEAEEAIKQKRVEIHKEFANHG